VLTQPGIHINADCPTERHICPRQSKVPFSYLAAFPENETEAFPFVPIEIIFQIINTISGINES